MSIKNLPILRRLQKAPNPNQLNNELVKKGWAGPLSSSHATYFTANGAVVAYRYITSSEIRQNYKAIAPLNTAVSLLADTAAAMPLALLNTENKQYLSKHPIFELLNRPNADYQKTKQSFFKALLTWKILEGDSFIIFTGDTDRPPLEMYVPAPATIRVEIDANTGYISKYIHETQSHREVYRRTTDDRFINATNNREMYHITGFTTDRAAPGDRGINGDSDIQSLYYEINQYMHSSIHNLNLLENGARPSGAFVLKDQQGQPAMLSDEQYDRLKQQMTESHTSAANAGKPLLLDGGLEWQEMGMSPKDLDFDKLRSSAKSAIYHKLGVPEELLAPSTTTAGNLHNIRLEFYENRVLPLLQDVSDHLTNSLLRNRYPRTSKFRLTIDRDQVDVLIPSRVKQRELIENSLVMTLNEKREQLHLSPIEGGDKIVDPNGRPIAGPDAGLIVGEENTTLTAPTEDEEIPKETEDTPEMDKDEQEG